MTDKYLYTANHLVGDRFLPVGYRLIDEGDTPLVEADFVIGFVRDDLGYAPDYKDILIGGAISHREEITKTLSIADFNDYDTFQHCAPESHKALRLSKEGHAKLVDQVCSSIRTTSQEKSSSIRHQTNSNGAPRPAQSRKVQPEWSNEPIFLGENPQEKAPSNHALVNGKPRGAAEPEQDEAYDAPLADASLGDWLTICGVVLLLAAGAMYVMSNLSIVALLAGALGLAMFVAGHFLAAPN